MLSGIFSIFSPGMRLVGGRSLQKTMLSMPISRRWNFGSSNTVQSKLSGEVKQNNQPPKCGQPIEAGEDLVS
jgi:hypothetical protein